MKQITTSFLSLMLSYPVWAQGKSNVQVEVHTSTPTAANNPASSIKVSTAAAAAGAQAEAEKLLQFSYGLKAPEAKVRLQSIRGLEALGPKAKDHAPALAALLTDRTMGLEAARALHAVDPAFAVPPETLKRLVKRAQIPVQREHVRSGWITSCEAQAYALDTLAALDAAAHSTLPDIVRLSHRPCIHDHVLDVLNHIGAPDPAQMAVIAGGMQESDPEARQAAIEYLAQAAEPNEASIQTLGRAMNDPDSGVRLSALQALEEIHPEGEGRLPVLVGFVKDPSPEIRERALYMIGQWGPSARSAAPVLRQALKDQDPLIVLTSAGILAKIDPQDEALINTLIAFAQRKGSAESAQAADLLQSLNIHNAKIDAALEPYRTQQSLSQRLNNASSDNSPEKVAENSRTLKVESLRMAGGIVNDHPVQVARSFPAKIGRIYCWTDISAGAIPAGVTHHWYRNGKLEREAYLEVSAASVPLWSSCAARPGSWKVTVTAVGIKEPLATAMFTVTGKK